MGGILSCVIGGVICAKYAIGIGLIHEFDISLFDDFRYQRDSDFHFNIKEINVTKTSISKSELWSMWTIISLCHDLGYPIEKTSQINNQAQKIISHFGSIIFNELNYNFDVLNTILVDKYLNIISSRVSDSKNLTVIQTKFKDKFSKSLEDYKHGMFSGLLLYKNLTYFLETDFSLLNTDLTFEDLRQFYIRKEILKAMAGHTCPKIYHLSLNTLSFLLILCDELQEWNRPKFDELKNGQNSKEPIVRIKKFEMSQNQIIHISFKYAFDLHESDRQYYVDEKFKNINNLLRSAKNDFERKIYFRWDLYFKNMVYKLIFDSKKGSFDQISCRKKKTNKGSVFSDYNLYI